MVSLRISTQIKHKVENFDIIISESDVEFERTGLLKTSLIRLGFLAVIPENMIEGVIGLVNKEIHEQLISNLISHLRSKNE